MGWHERLEAWGKHKRRKAPARFESINRELRELIAGGRRESVSLRNLLSGGESSSHEEKSVHTMSRALHNKTLVFLLRMRRAMGLCVRGGWYERRARERRAAEECESSSKFSHDFLSRVSTLTHRNRSCARYTQFPHLVHQTGISTRAHPDTEINIVVVRPGCFVVPAPRMSRAR